MTSAPRLGAARLAAVLLVVAALGCRAAPQAPVVVEFWAMGSEGERVQRLLAEFEKQTPGVRVRVQQIPWSAAHEKLLTAYVGDAMPDIFQLGNTWIPEFVALNAIERLDERLAHSSLMQVDDYFAGVLDTNVIDGALYGVPWYVDTRVLFYRTDLLQQAGVDAPPATWEAWLDAMLRIKAHAGRDAYAILLPMTEWQPPVILALQRGARLLREDNQYGDFRSPEFRAAFEFYLDLFRRDLAPRDAAAQVANLYQDFASGYFAFYITGPWNIREFQRRLPATLTGKWATAPMPAPDATHPGLSTAGGASLALFRGSRHRDAAWQVIAFLSTPARQIEFYRLTGDLPARKTAWTQQDLMHDRYAHAFWQQLQHVHATPKIPEWERIADKITQYAEAAIRGGMDVDAALAALDTDVDQVLEKRRWLLRRRAAVAAGRPRP
jgi:multiple sugar transport system substrate-binding protein